MQFAALDGVDTLVAVYAFSQLVTIPVAELKDGARVRGRTVGDMGNGQPISMMSDASPFMPAGPVGKEVLFVGSSLRADLFSDRFFVSLTRYAEGGDLVLETLPVGPIPARLDKVWVEFDFPGFA